MEGGKEGRMAGKIEEREVVEDRKKQIKERSKRRKVE